MFRNPFHAIRYIPGSQLAYLRNPKVASSAITMMLWRAHDPVGAPALPPPRYDAAPFLRHWKDLTEDQAAGLARAKFFSAVRNPYARTLSAYLSKVMRRPWERIAPSFGLSPEQRPPLSELLRIIKESDPTVVDQHFRPQHVNLLHGFAPLDFVGHLELPDRLDAWLLTFGFKLERYDDSRDRTDAYEKLSQIDDKTAALIRDVYADDFRLFGYSTDMKQLAPIASAIADSDRQTLKVAMRRRVERCRG